MKVVHLVAGSLDGGAARGAYWLHRGLIDLGVDSKIITDDASHRNDPSVVVVQVSGWKRVVQTLSKILEKIVVSIYRDRQKRIFSSGIRGLEYWKNYDFKSADIVHLHWVNGLVSTFSLPKIKQPVVWTLRDMWPMTGGCHYALGCERFKSGCGHCPQLASKSDFDISKLFFLIKKNNVPKYVFPVGISSWITSEVRKSPIFSKFNSITIVNNIDTSLFFPEEKKCAKDYFKIYTEKKIVLLGATDVRSFYKGYEKAAQALRLIEHTESIAICIFGNSGAKELKDIGFECVELGYLNDEKALRMAYSMADVFLAPSTYEAFGKTLAEALACGTPVVCFDATGPSDIVSHKQDGYKALPYSPEDLAEGLSWVIEHPNYSSLAEAARGNAMRKFGSSVAANRYKTLYEDILCSIPLDQRP